MGRLQPRLRREGETDTAMLVRIVSLRVVGSGVATGSVRRMDGIARMRLRGWRVRGVLGVDCLLAWRVVACGRKAVSAVGVGSGKMGSCWYGVEMQCVGLWDDSGRGGD